MLIRDRELLHGIVRVTQGRRHVRGYCLDWRSPDDGNGRVMIGVRVVRIHYFDDDGILIGWLRVQEPYAQGEDKTALSAYENLFTLETPTG